MSIPANLRLPAEYEPQAAMWLSWPGNPETWPHHREDIESDYADLVARISDFQQVNLICSKDLQRNARHQLKAAGASIKQVEFFDIPTNDAWCRDHGPLFLQSDEGLVVGDIPYNGWGGKFPPWDFDDLVPKEVSELRNLPCVRLPIFGEGGALEVNSQGTLITTESVWLNPNRNPDLTKKEAEKIFADYLGVKKTIWLPEGLEDDDTDGHIDNLTRFVADDTVVTAMADKDDENYEVLLDNRDLLAEHFNVIELPHPRQIQPEGWEEEILPASYANFVVMNNAVLVPIFRQGHRDEDALDTLHAAFPKREIVGVDCTHFIWEGGGVHCLTMQEPQA